MKFFLFLQYLAQFVFVEFSFNRPNQFTNDFLVWIYKNRIVNKFSNGFVAFVNFCFSFLFQ